MFIEEVRLYLVVNKIQIFTKKGTRTMVIIPSEIEFVFRFLLFILGKEFIHKTVLYL